MRLWTIHPEYLDGKGLVALWGEALLAKKVLEGKTKGYRNHPQLNRFNSSVRSTDAINAYLLEIWNEAFLRKYDFDRSKINDDIKKIIIFVNQGQINYEFDLLLQKLKKRDSERFNIIKDTEQVKINNIFKTKPGGVEKWEKVRDH